MGHLVRLEMTVGDPPEELISFESGVVTVGREPENHLQIMSDSVSRRHGLFKEAGRFWVYRDLGSSNGSWLNGEKVDPDVMRLVKHGDLVRIADVELRFVVVGEAGQGLAPHSAPDLAGNALAGSGVPTNYDVTLLVFFGDRFEGEFTLRVEGHAFQIGGPGSQIVIPGYAGAQPLCEFRKTRRGVDVRPAAPRDMGAGEYELSVNNHPLRNIGPLADRDIVTVDRYKVLINLTPFTGSAEGYSPEMPGLQGEPAPGFAAPSVSLQSHGSLQMSHPYEGGGMFSAEGRSGMRDTGHGEHRDNDGGGSGVYPSPSRPSSQSLTSRRQFVFGGGEARGLDDEYAESDTVEMKYDSRDASRVERGLASQRFSSDNAHYPQGEISETIRAVLGLVVLLIIVGAVVFLVITLQGSSAPQNESGPAAGSASAPASAT